MYLHFTLKVMKINYRKTSWDSEFLFFFHLVEMLQPPCYQIRLFSPYILPNVPATFSTWSQSLYWTFTWAGKSPILQQTRGLNRLSGNNSLALYLRFSRDPTRVSQISEWLSLVVQRLVIHLQHFWFCKWIQRFVSEYNNEQDKEVVITLWSAWCNTQKA